MIEQDKSETAPNQDGTPQRVPNENIGFYFSSSLKITDPDSGEVLVQTRAD
jgi:hypothetical protein